MKISYGVINEDNVGQANVEIPDHMLIIDVCDPIQAIIDLVYPSFISELQSTKIRTYFHQCAIFPPIN